MMNGYNFTERVRACLAMAREEAARLHHAYVDTEHALLGVLRSDGVATESIDSGVPPCGLSALAAFGNDLLLSREPASLQIFRATPMALTLSLVADLGDGFVPYRGSVATPGSTFRSDVPTPTSSGFPTTRRIGHPCCVASKVTRPAPCICGH
jgi:hypothetical protein